MGVRQEHFRMFALYNRWANERLYDCAAQLTPAALAEDRGAFFGSLLGTLNHLLVTDRLWMSRLEGVSPRGTRLNEILHENFDDLRAARRAQDEWQEQQRRLKAYGVLAERHERTEATRDARREQRENDDRVSQTFTRNRPLP